MGDVDLKPHTFQTCGHTFVILWAHPFVMLIAPWPSAHPAEFRRHAIELARLTEKAVVQIAIDLGISDSCPLG